MKPIFELFKNEEKSNKIINFINSKKNITPSKQKIFKSFDIDESELKYVFVNHQPFLDHNVASGLLFGSELKNNDKPVQFVNFTNFLAVKHYHDIALDENEIDFSFKCLLDQNVLNINVCLATESFTKQKDDAINDKDSDTYFWKTIIMDELFYYLNYFDKPLHFVFFGDSETLNYYKKSITNFYHTVHESSNFLNENYLQQQYDFKKTDIKFKK